MENIMKEETFHGRKLEGGNISMKEETLLVE